MASSSMSLVCSLVAVVLLAGLCGVLGSARFPTGRECGQMCGGYAGLGCVPECHCVYYPGDLGLYTQAWLDFVRLAFSSTMASLSMSFMCHLLMVVLLASHGGLLTSAYSDGLVECGKTCGGFMQLMCVAECHCVFYPASDFGVCLPLIFNETNLPELRFF
ncbi:hypothetical protein MRX96_059193 [Rhipicephalus microplus]